MINTKFDELLQFPCSFSYRVIANTGVNFHNDVKKIIENITNKEVVSINQINTSKNGKYTSTKVTVKVKNKSEIEQIYSGITKIEGIKLVL